MGKRQAEGPELADVLRTEHAAIRARRRAITTPSPADADVAPPTDVVRSEEDAPPADGAPPADIVGLALSGGGIRSATFSLGVVQALGRAGLLPFVDYLSTVSGGGFLGGAVSALLSTPSAGPERERFPLCGPSGQPEPPAVRHLRHSSHYLAPGGLLDRVRLPLLLVRGALVNVAIFLPYIVAAALVTELGFEWMHTILPDDQVHNLWGLVPLLFIALFVAAVLVYPIAATAFRHRLGWVGRNRYDRLLGVLCLLIFFGWGMAVFSRAIELAIGSDPAAAMHAARQTIERVETWRFTLLWLLPAGVIAVVASMMLGRGRAARIGRAFGIHALGLLAPATLVLIYFGALTYWVSSPYLPVSLVPSLDRGEVSPALEAEMVQKALELEGPDTFVSVVEPGQRWVLGDTGYTYRIGRRDDVLQINWRDMWLAEWDGYVWAFTLALLLLNRAALSINTSSGNGFYRDRLSRAYLIRRSDDDEVSWVDDLRLSKLNGPGTAAPYHLINAAMNLQGSDDPDLRGREADFFLFSPGWSGSRRTGYCATADLERADPNFDLATAMAISGAAVAPNMGDVTNRALTFDMTMLNFRLAYWLPNPARVRLGLHWPRWRWQWTVPGASYLWREAVGRMVSTSRFVNVSDGGHIENLGVYSLLERRCALIIAVDGEADPGMTFPSLIRLIRYARIDLGITIDIDIARLKALAEGYHGAHWTIGRIDYGDGQSGVLCYLKLSLTGDERLDVLAYRAGSPSFPHESTAEQFFSEEQFEAYRALGYHIGRRVFEGAAAATSGAALAAALSTVGTGEVDA